MKLRCAKCRKLLATISLCVKPLAEIVAYCKRCDDDAAAVEPYSVSEELSRTMAVDRAYLEGERWPAD